jgi:hypothetical protein
MQNAHQDDLLTGQGIDKSKYCKCRYVRKDDVARKNELKQQGYILINEDESSDLTLMGLPIKEEQPKPKRSTKKEK